jgi:3'(2'), 5'-bisphosphate nucleotidase
MMSIDTAALVEPVKEIAAEAGARIVEIYSTGFEVAEKDDQSPLTTADLASHQTIVNQLQKLTPDIPILSEESATIAFAERSHWQRFWLIDPLDGTKEFIKRNGEFTVNIALVEGHEPVLSVVLMPVTKRCYWAARGNGAWRQEADGPVQQIAVTPLGNGPIRVVGSRSHGGDSLNSFLARLGDYDLVSIGSSLKLCLVAEGKADIYPRLGPTSEWDTAAAQCIVEEAGGQVVTCEGQRLTYNSKESLLNPHFLVFGDAKRNWLGYLSASS